MLPVFILFTRKITNQLPAIATLPMPANETNYTLPLFVGVDVGGTNVKIGVVDDDGQTVAETKFPTQPNKSPELAFEQAKRELDQLITAADFTWDDVAVAGLGTPGPMDIKSGLILTPTNLPGWHNFPVRESLAKALGKEVTYANDAGAAAFGEYWVGSGKNYSSMVLLTLGTGVGGGIIVNDISIDGMHSHGAEVGHMTVDTSADALTCGCGQAGHLEAYASATALVSRTRTAMATKNGDNCDSILRQQMGDASPLSALMISEAAAAGDSLASRMISQTAEYLGRGIAQLAHVIDPEAFILGGAMNFGGAKTPLGQKFLDEVVAAVRKLVFPVLGQELIVKYARLGSEAGFVGAAGLARSEYNRSVTAK